MTDTTTILHYTTLHYQAYYTRGTPITRQTTIQLQVPPRTIHVPHLHLPYLTILLPHPIPEQRLLFSTPKWMRGNVQYSSVTTWYREVVVSDGEGHVLCRCAVVYCSTMGVQPSRVQSSRVAQCTLQLVHGGSLSAVSCGCYRVLQLCNRDNTKVCIFSNFPPFGPSPSLHRPFTVLSPSLYLPSIYSLFTLSLSSYASLSTPYPHLSYSHSPYICL